MALPFTLTKIVNSVIWFSVVGFSITSAEASAVFSYSANVTKLVGMNATVTWSFELKDVVAVQFSDGQSIIMIVRSFDGSVVRTRNYPNSPFFKHIMWKGNLSEGRASFYLTNVTREMFGPVTLSMFTSNQSHANTVYLRVLEYPNKPTTNCGSVRKIGERSLLNCSCAVMGGFPLPVVYWVSPAGDRKESELVVRNISRNQSGNYTCIALNEAGNRTVNIKVDVQYPVAIETFSSSSRKSFVGQHATMRCYSEGNPKPTYRWITPNPLVNFTSSLEYGYGILHVVFTRPEDFGSYTCVASNSISSNNRSITVTQIHPPGKVSFVKNYTGVHEVFLEWSKPAKDGDSPILNYVITIIGENNHTRETNKTTIEIKNLFKNTSYGFCVQARNKVGKGKPKCIDITTLYVGPPERPVISVRLLPNNKDVEVSWNSGERATYYVVRYRKQGEEIWIEKNLTGLSQLVHELKDLTPGLTYEFQLLAGNGYGKSRPSDGRTVTIPLATTEEPVSTQRSTTANPAPEKNESKKLKTTLIAISVLIGLLLILAVVFFILWMKRRSGRENPPAHPVEHVPGPLNGDVYAMVETAKKTSKKSKKESDLVYAELSDLSPTGDEEKPPTYVPTDYADIAQILTPDGDLTYSNVQPRCAQEGAYANVKDMGTE